MPTSYIRRIAITVFTGLFLFHAAAECQSFRFRNYLPETYVYSISQDKNGFLWLGTGNGISKFDGFSFYPVVFPDSLVDRIANVTFCDSKGRIWVGFNDGSLFYTSEDGLVQIPDLGVQSISDIFETTGGFIFVIPQDRYILRINSADPQEISRYSVPATVLMTSGCMTSDGSLLLGTSENLLHCTFSNDSVTVKSVVEGIEYTRVQSVRQAKGKPVYLVGTEDGGLFSLVFRGELPVLRRFSNHSDLETMDIKSVHEDSEGNFWLSTDGAGLIRISLSEDGNTIESYFIYSASSGMISENVRTAFQDMEGNIWIGFYGDGLSMLSSNAFSFYSPGGTPDDNDIIFITENNNRYFLGTPNGYYIYDLNNGKTESFTDLAQQTGTDNITCYHLDENKDLWIGTSGRGLYYKSQSGRARLFYYSDNTAEDKIRHITSQGKYLWLSTLDGIIVLEKLSGAVIKKLKREDRLPHNSISQIYIRRDGRVIPAAECDRIYTIDPDYGVTIGDLIMQGVIKNKVLCYAETSDSNLLAGTEGNGIFYFVNDSVKRITSQNGLLSNYCYSMLIDSEERAWIGHVKGFSRYDLRAGTIKSFSTDFAKGGDCNANALYEDRNGRVLIGTTEGLIVYDAQKDKKSKLAPISNIISVTINNERWPLLKSYNLPYSSYTFRIDYVGISLTDPEKVYYNTKLDNLNEKWSETKVSRSVEYPLRDGRYRFNLISVNEEGLSGGTPLNFDIYIKKPFWRTWWFILSLIIFASGIIVLIVREREKAQKKIKEYLERELAERTRLVMKQKDEIELQNIEITDSINYAKRIQSSILPDNNRLKETFADAFILFHPRDIVSGDFYWFDKISDEKFMIVCADSTGHGVPGAFMSMIGSTLLQDIISRKGITRPSLILGMLDKQIFSTLNQNVDVGVSNDGMDMVVCEVNTNTKHVRFASAMRPVIIVMGGESYYIKGNRCSVGGESVIEKYFDDQEYYLSAGDTIYMFSDGLPDQFGGKDGKKMKIARLKKLIEEVSKIPMSEQKELISNFFFDWKGDYEQVDDILLMGIRL